MRVLFLSPWFPYPLDTGSRVRVYHHLRALCSRHEATLLTLDPQGWAPAEVEAIAPLCQQVALVSRDPFHHNRLRTATRFASLRPIVNAPFSEMTRLVRRLHAEQHFEAAIAGTAVMATYVLALPGVTLILEEHNSHTRWMRDRYLAQTSPLQRLRCWVSWRKSALYESRLFSRFDLVTMTSERDARTTRGLLDGGRSSHAGHPPVALVPNGVDCEQFRPGLAEPRPGTLVFGGALAYGANYEAMQFFLEQVYPQIRRQYPNVRLSITGSSKGVDLDKLPLDDSVTLTGFVDDVRPVVARSWAAVVPILSGGGTRIKILEAMALGTPVVATSKGAEGLDVTPGHDILVADEPAGLAAQVVRLLRDPALRQRLAANARRLIEQRYDWAQIGQRFAELVENVAGEKRCGNL